MTTELDAREPLIPEPPPSSTPNILEDDDVDDVDVDDDVDLFSDTEMEMLMDPSKFNESIEPDMHDKETQTDIVSMDVKLKFTQNAETQTGLC